jgi:hypothetical protein
MHFSKLVDGLTGGGGHAVGHAGGGGIELALAVGGEYIFLSCELGMLTSGVLDRAAGHALHKGSSERSASGTFWLWRELRAL